MVSTTCGSSFLLPDVYLPEASRRLFASHGGSDVPRQTIITPWNVQSQSRVCKGLLQCMFYFDYRKRFRVNVSTSIIKLNNFLRCFEIGFVDVVFART